MKKALLASASLLILAGAANAETIDFGAITPGPITSASGVTFSLAGGPDSAGSPVVGYGYFDSRTSLNNSTHFGEDTSGYPTANILNLAFSGLTSDISFTFSNYGSGNGTFYTAFGPGNTVVSTGSLDSVEGFALVNVLGSGITSLQFNNNVGPLNNWIFGVGEITFTSDVPEPATWGLMILGFAAVGGAMRARARHTSVSYA